MLPHLQPSSLRPAPFGPRPGLPPGYPSTEALLTKPPFLLSLAVFLISCALAFSIYGSPPIPQVGRLTFMRCGTGLLLLTLPLYANRVQPLFSRAVVGIFIGFLCLRWMSYIISPGKDWGTSQILWFTENITSFLLLSAACREYPKLFVLFVRCVTGAMVVSAAIMVFQYTELTVRGFVTPLPLSTSSFGVDEFTNGGWYPTGADNRIIGTFQDPNLAGSVLIMWMTILSFYVLRARGRHRTWAFAALALGLLAVLATGSRQAMVALVIAGLWLLWKKAKAGQWISVVMALAVAALAAFFVFSQVKQALQGSSGDEGPALIQRIAKAATSEEDQTGGRVRMMQELISGLNASSLALGKGEGTGYWSAHNAWLIVLEENGIWAVFLLLGGSITFIVYSNRFANPPPVAPHLARVNPLLSPMVLAAREAAPVLVGLWVFFITVNWAQLNQNACWIFLTLAFAGTVATETVSGQMNGPRPPMPMTPPRPSPHPNAPGLL